MVYILTLRQCFLFRKVVLSQVYLIAELVLTDCVKTTKAILRYQNRGRSTCVDLLPPENLVNDGTVKKKVDSYIRYPDGKCGLSHYPSSIRRSHTHVVIVTNWCCKILTCLEFHNMVIVESEKWIIIFFFFTEWNVRAKGEVSCE